MTGLGDKATTEYRCSKCDREVPYNRRHWLKGQVCDGRVTEIKKILLVAAQKEIQKLQKLYETKFVCAKIHNCLDCDDNIVCIEGRKTLSKTVKVLEKKLKEWERDWKWHLKNDCTPTIVVKGLERDKKNLEKKLGAVQSLVDESVEKVRSHINLDDSDPKSCFDVMVALFKDELKALLPREKQKGFMKAMMRIEDEAKKEMLKPADIHSESPLVGSKGKEP